MAELERLERGTQVITSDGHILGYVKELLEGGRYFQVDCPLAPDFYIPAECVAGLTGGVVRLKASRLQATNSGWEARPRGDGNVR